MYSFVLFGWCSRQGRLCYGQHVTDIVTSGLKSVSMSVEIYLPPPTQHGHQFFLISIYVGPME